MRNKLLNIKNNDWPFILFGHLSFIILLFASVYYYKERIIFFDSAFQFFKIVNFEKVNIEAYRYGAVLPQIPVLIAIKLGCSLKLLTIIFSVSFIALYYSIFLICITIFKNIGAGLSVILILIMNINQSFFHPVTETHQCLVYSVLLFCVLQHSTFRYSFIQAALASIIIILSFLTHPVAVYLLTFIVVYNAIDKKQFKSFLTYALLFLIIGMAVGKVLLTNENSYEGKFFTGLLQSPSLIFELPFTASTEFLLKRVHGLYFWTVVLEVILIAYLIIKREYMKLTWQLSLSAIFLAVTLLIYNNGDSEIMMERAFMPLALLIAVPLMKEMFESELSHKFIKSVIILLVIGSSFNRLYSQGTAFKARTRFSQELMVKTSKLPNKKYIAESSELQKNHYTFWSHSFETLLLSAITLNIPTQTIYPANDTSKLTNYTENATNVFLGTDFWLEWGIDNLNQKYFKLPTDQSYAIIRIDEL